MAYTSDRLAMQNKVVLITGANSGIGKVTARELAKMGAHIVMACRNREKGEIAQAEIISESGNKNVDLFIVDMSSFASIRELAASFIEKYDRLHVLINNAGGLVNPYRVTANGVEASFAVNYLGPFLLTHLLLDRLKESAPARIINLGSGLHAKGRIDFDNLMMKDHYGFIQAYANAKLAILMFTYDIAHRLKDTGVTANAVHPGVVRTNFGRKSGFPWYVMPLLIFVKPFMISVDKGAETPIYLASSKNLERVTGKYFFKGKETKSAPQSYDKKLGTKLWQFSIKLTGLRN